MLPVWHFLEPYSSIVYVHQLCLFQYWVSPCNIWQVQPNNRIKKNQGCSYIYICNKIVFRQRISLHQSPFFARDLELLKRGAPKDQVSFVHPLTDVLVNISTDTQLMYIGRHITWVSTDMFVLFAVIHWLLSVFSNHVHIKLLLFSIYIVRRKSCQYVTYSTSIFEQENKRQIR